MEQLGAPLASTRAANRSELADLVILAATSIAAGAAAQAPQSSRVAVACARDSRSPTSSARCMVQHVVTGWSSPSHAFASKLMMGVTRWRSSIGHSAAGPVANMNGRHTQQVTGSTGRASAPAMLPARLPIAGLRCSRQAAARMVIVRQASRRGASGGLRSHLVCRSEAGYAANSTDALVLKMNPRTELRGDQITNVFGYARNMETKYDVGRVLGAGSFGVVRECVEKATGRKYAVKTITKAPKRGAPTPRYLLKLRTEVDIMQQLGYSLDAVNLKDVFEDDSSIHLVMQLCSGGALFERIEKERYSEKYIVLLVRSILRFISQCHAKGFIYRDVKADNFLFESNSPESPLKATDFGLSIKYSPGEPKLSSRSGTPAYMAPELIMQSYDYKCDIWSVGMLAYQLLTGRFPFWEDVRHETLTNVWKAILTQNFNWNAEELRQLSRPCVDFLKAVLERDPNKRLSAEQALEHPWIADASGAADLPLGGSVVQRLQRFSTYGLLKQMVFKMILEELSACDDVAAKSGLSPSLMASLKELFEQLDSDKSGSISFEELTAGLRKQGYVLSDSEIEQLMRKCDFDNDGSVGVKELMTTLIDWKTLQTSQGWQAYIDRAFAILDKDGNGTITLDELMARLPSHAATTGLEVSAEERQAAAKQMLREADSNGDGRISKSEFDALLREAVAEDSLSFYDDRVASNISADFEDLTREATPTPSAA